MFAAIAAIRRWRERGRQKPSTADRQETPAPRRVNLDVLARGTVPAHGFVVTGAMGMGARVGWGSKFLPWFKRLLGACAVASAIAMGLFVYTEFVGAWKNRGLPTIPITALSAIEQVGQTGGVRTVGAKPPSKEGGTQQLDLLSTYVG